MTESNGAADAAADPRRWSALWVLACGLAMIVLDGTIVGVAIPTIIGDLDLDLTQAQWVNSLYNVVFAAFLLTTGRLGDRFGRRRMFLLGLMLFGAGSVLAALSGGATALIWARVVQGLGGAMILPSTLSTVNAMFQGRERAAAFGVWGAVMSGAAALGPLLGGWLTETLAWQWIFWVNVPIGLVLFALALVFVPETRSSVHTRGLDVDGLLTSGIGFGAVVFALIEGNSLGWWRPKGELSLFGLTWPTSAPISLVPVIALIGVIFIGLFLRWEVHRARVQRDRLLDLDLFRHRTFSWGNVTALMVAIGEFGLILVLPLFLVNALGLSTLRTGFVLAAMALGAFLSGASARHLAARFGPATVVIGGLGLEVVGVAALAVAVAVGLSVWLLAAFLVCYGIGLGLASAQLTSTVLRDVPTEQSGSGSATQSTVRQLGAALGSAVAGTALATALSHTVPQHLAAIGVPDQTAEPLAQATANSGGSVLPAWAAHPAPGVTPQVLDALTAGMADATQIALWVAAAFLLLGLVASVMVRRAA